MGHIKIIKRGGWIVFILLFFFFLNGCYIGTTTLSGILLDKETSNPISGAELLLTQRVTYSHEDGHFFFSSIPYGPQVLHISVPFYKDIDYPLDIDKPYYELSAPIYLSPFDWEEDSGTYKYNEDDRFSIYASLKGVNFSEEELLPWGDDLIEKMKEITGENSIVPFSIYTAWPEDEVSMESIKAFTIYSKGEIHILDEVLGMEEDLKREIFAHEFTHLFLYRYAHITEPFIQEGLAFYFPSFILGYGTKYDYIFYKRHLIYYLTPSYIPSWKEAGTIYSHPKNDKIFWFSVYELRSIFYFLADKYGKEKVVTFFKKLKWYNNNFDSLFLDVFGKNMNDLEKEWVEYFSLTHPGERMYEKVSPTYIY